jgi:hypothetical protein
VFSKIVYYVAHDTEMLVVIIMYQIQYYYVFVDCDHTNAAVVVTICFNYK